MQFLGGLLIASLLIIKNFVSGSSYSTGNQHEIVGDKVSNYKIFYLVVNSIT